MFTQQLLRPVGVLFSLMVCGWSDGQPGGRQEKIDQAASQKLSGVGS